MRKILLISVFCFTISILNCAENGITKVLDVFSMNINYKNTVYGEYIIKAGKNIMVRIDSNLFINTDKFIKYWIFLKPKSAIDDTKKKYNELKIVNGNAEFGSDLDSFFLNKFGAKYKSKNKIEIIKCSLPSGGISTDELVYNFKITKSKYFDECLIVFFDVWDSKKFGGSPDNLSNKLIDELKKNKDPRADNYIMIDKIIDSIQFIDDKSNDVKKK
jgi:hypothetical protein